MPENQTLELIRDMIRSQGDQLLEIRSNQGRMSDQLSRLADSADRTHTEIFDRLREVERASQRPDAAQGILERLGLAWKFAWPVLVVIAVLWRDATPKAKERAWSSAAQAAGLNLPQSDAESGASWIPRWHASPNSTASVWHPK